MTNKKPKKGEPIMTDDELIEALVVIGIVLKNLSKKVMMRSLNQSVEGGQGNAKQNC